jgi:hypothetical protein
MTFINRFNGFPHRATPNRISLQTVGTGLRGSLAMMALLISEVLGDTADV